MAGTIYVVTNSDGSTTDPSKGSLGYALAHATNGEAITFAPTVTTIDLEGTFVISKSVTIDGANINGNPGVTISGDHGTTNAEDFFVNGGVDATINGLVIRDGSMSRSPSGHFAGYAEGQDGAAAAGGIYISGYKVSSNGKSYGAVLNLSNSVVTADRAVGGQGGTGVTGTSHYYSGYPAPRVNGWGGAGGSAAGGIYVGTSGTLNLVGSRNAFSSNTAQGGMGGSGADGPQGDGGSGGTGSYASSSFYHAGSAGTAGDGSRAGAGGALGAHGKDGYVFGGGGGGGGKAFANYGGGGTINVNAPCFVSGTLVSTVRGAVAVEDLAVGDQVVTSSGAVRPIRWIGHRTIDCRRHPRPHEAMPVRIAAHAFGANRPARDLLVSPGHSICVDVLGEVLIPAIALADGIAIAQVAVAKVIYWHVELESHDILLAEGLATESYLEMGNRTFFVEAGMVDLQAGPDSKIATHADFCRPFINAGPLLDAVRTLLRRRSLDARSRPLRYAGRSAS